MFTFQSIIKPNYLNMLAYYKYLHECIEEVQGESSNLLNGTSKLRYFSFGSLDGIGI